MINTVLTTAYAVAVLTCLLALVQFLFSTLEMIITNRVLKKKPVRLFDWEKSVPELVTNRTPSPIYSAKAQLRIQRKSIKQGAQSDTVALG